MIRPNGRVKPSWLLGTVALVLLTRLPAVLHRRAIDDEVYYAVVADEMLHGGLPYRDAVDRKPPLLYAIYWAAFRVAGFPNWVALHLLAVVWTLATMGVLWLLGRRLFSASAGILAAILYGAFQPFLTLSNLAFNGELLMNLPLAAALLVLLRTHSGARREPLLAGALVGLAFLLKQPAGIGLVPLGVYALSRGHRRRGEWSVRDGWQAAVLVGVGFAAVLGLTAAVLASRGILAEAWYWVVRDHDVPHGPLDPVFWQRLGVRGGLFLLCTGPLVLGTWETLTARERWTEREPERDALVALVLASLVGTAASGRFFLHYFLQLLLPLALLASPSLLQRWDRGGAARRTPLGSLTLGWSVLSVLVSLGIISVQGLVVRHPLPPAVAWLKANAQVEARLFVWGQDPHIYLDSGLRPASRYFASFPLTGYAFGTPEGQDPRFDTSDRAAPHAWDNLARDFERHPPDFIIDTDAVRAVPRYPIARFPYLARLLDQEYLLVFRGADGLVYQRRGDAGARTSGESRIRQVVVGRGVGC